MKRSNILFTILTILLVTFLFQVKIKQMLSPLTNKLTGQATVAQRVEQYGSAAKERLMPYFEVSGVNYPPSELILVGFKQEKILEIWAKDSNTEFKKIKDYPILGYSGELGPKLKEGDRQIPEGIYKIESLNRNSRFHLALRLNYPNEFDLEHAKAEGRTNPGSDIMIHGNSVSIGCLAMGNEPIEEIFVLVSQTGIENTKVVLAPVDFRRKDLPEIKHNLPDWTEELYSNIQKELELLKP
jgi:murein L,D-transpeptidase YafK